VTAGLGDDFNAALDQPALAPVGFEGVKSDARHFALEMIDSLDNVREARG
jgi:hypothetical protein